MKERCTALENLRSELQQDVGVLRSKHEEGIQELNKVAQDLAVAKELLELSKKQISAKEDDLEAAARRLDEEAAKFRQLQDTHKDTLSAASERGIQVADLKRLVSELENSLSEKNDSVNEAHTRLEANNELLSELRTTKAKLEAQCLKQENQIEELNEKLQQSASDKADVESVLSKERAKLADASQAHLSALAALREEVSQKVAELSSAEHAAKKAASKRTRLEEKVAELNTKLEKSAVEVEELTGVVTSGKGLAAEMAKVQQTLEEQRKKRIVAERAQKKAHKELSEAKVAHKKAIEETKETVRDEILADLGAEMDRLKAQSEVLEKQLTNEFQQQLKEKDREVKQREQTINSLLIDIGSKSTAPTSTSTPKGRQAVAVPPAQDSQDSLTNEIPTPPASIQRPAAQQNKRKRKKSSSPARKRRARRRSDVLRGAATAPAAPKAKKTGLPGGFQELDIVVPYQKGSKKSKGTGSKQAGDIFEDIFAFTDSN